ncbi:MAG: ComEC/Rec2 family competence protein [Akkermansiaceae bacterium]
MLNDRFGPGGWIADFEGRHPLFIAALVASSCVAIAAQHPVAGFLVASLWAVAGFFLRSWRHGLAWWFCGSLAVGVFTWRNESRASAEQSLIQSPGGPLQGRVLSDAKGNRYWSAPVTLIAGPHEGAKVWWQGRGETPVAGAIVSSRGNFAELPLPRNPGEFDQAAWLRSLGVAAVFDASRSHGVVETGGIARLGSKIRQSFRAAVTAGLEVDSQQARVIRAIVIGEQPPDSEVLVAAFRNSGTLHAFSVSGLHVAMVGSIGWLILRFLGVPRRWAVLGLLPLIFGYSWITGNSPPAVRSAWMAAVFLGAFVFRRRPDLLNALGAVLLAAMLWDGRLLFQAGVQLSYGVVAAIAIGTAWASRVFTWLAKPELYLPLTQMSRWQLFSLRLRRNIAQSLGVSLAAGIGSTPLTAFHFGLVTPISVFAGIVLVPIVFVLLCAALLAAALYPLAPPLSRLVTHANAKVADVCVFAAQGFAAIPGGHFQLRGSQQPFLLVYELEYGAATACFSAGNHAAVLIDCADPYSFKRRIVPSLRRLGITPDSVVLSHPDGGHLGGGAPVWDAFPIRQALLPVDRSRSPAFRSWIDSAPQAGVKLIHAAQVSELPMPDGARLEILHTPNPLARDALADERVAIFRLHWRGWKILFTSDAGIATELELLATQKDLTADLIIAGRHRTDLSLSDAFLDAVNPRAILASNAAFPVEERLNPRRVAYWKSRQIQVIDPSKTGGVTLTIDESGALRLQGFADGSTVVLPRQSP